MKISKDGIKAFQEAIFAEFGEQISERDAEKQGQSLLTFLKVFFDK
jgi:hypothetical protein